MTPSPHLPRAGSVRKGGGGLRQTTTRCPPSRWRWPCDLPACGARRGGARLPPRTTGSGPLAPRPVTASGPPSCAASLGRVLCCVPCCHAVLFIVPCRASVPQRVPPGVTPPPGLSLSPQPGAIAPVLALAPDDVPPFPFFVCGSASVAWQCSRLQRAIAEDW